MSHIHFLVNNPLAGQFITRKAKSTIEMVHNTYTKLPYKEYSANSYELFMILKNNPLSLLKRTTWTFCRKPLWQATNDIHCSNCMLNTTDDDILIIMFCIYNESQMGQTQHWTKHKIFLYYSMFSPRILYISIRQFNFWGVIHCISPFNGGASLNLLKGKAGTHSSAIL